MKIYDEFSFMTPEMHKSLNEECRILLKDRIVPIYEILTPNTGKGLNPFHPKNKYSPNVEWWKAPKKENGNEQV